MRALLVEPGPNFSVQDVADGWAAGLTELGIDVRRFDLGGAMTYHERALQAAGVADTESGQEAAHGACRDLRQAAFDWWPDFILVVSSFFISPFTYRVLRARGMRIVIVCTESPYEDENQYKLARWADICLVNDPVNLAQFRERNRRTYYVPHAYNPHVHKPGPVLEQYRSDVCFVGTGYPSRIKFLEDVDWKGLDVAVAGNWSELSKDSPLRKYVATDDPRLCCDNAEAVKLYNSALASFNVYRVEAQTAELAAGYAMGPREVELAACGTFYVTQERPENREVLPMVPTFSDAAELGPLLRSWLCKPQRRNEIARAAREAIAGRTFANHAAELLRRLDALPTSKGL